ncbi:conserved hypothetical protein [Culex quinquefasciatus]|uniref:Uncharacterized protein n=1 Tax=Culex quinquefasciatus TaxID=7176 RepID=B0WL24_CULQU|nr:conserved hypothetical protein [Culex quinquefasciatus]|eukprot:XP_001849408.1 conserved hypothetical protein [Culex quinquefasciatus]
MEKLVQKCLVPGCESTTDDRSRTFFEFPADRDVVRAWNKAMGFRANCKHIPEPRVCERHFTEEEVVEGRLVEGAVPSVEVGRVKSGEGGLMGESADPSYCRLCAKQERQPLKNTIGKMMRCAETARLLEICLEPGRDDERLPAGVCDACSHMMKYVLKFVRTCCGAQGKLSRIMDERIKNEGLKGEEEEGTVPPVPVVKMEAVEDGGTLPTDYLMIGLEKEEKGAVPRYIVDEVVDDEDGPTDREEVDVKLEPVGRDGSDSEYELPDDFHASSGSSSSDSEDDEYDPDDEDLQRMKQRVKIEDGEPEEKPVRRRGRPRKNDPKVPKGPRKRREKRDKSLDEKPASMSKQICQVCGKILSSSATFNVHMMTHTNQKDIACPICDKKFYVKQQLKIHMESIHEKKDFVCNICGLKCRWRKSLRRHMLLHEDNPYKHKCTYCDKAFARPNQLRYHVMKHTGDRVYCEICGADYRFNYMLTQHKIRKHGVIVEGVQLYKQTARKKKSESGEPPGPRKIRIGAAAAAAAAAGQPVNLQHPPQHHQQLLSPPPPSLAVGSTSSVISHLALPEHDRTNQSDLSSHVSDLGSPATNASYATITSPEPPHFPGHHQQHPALQHQQLQHHQHQMGGGFNGAGLAMAMPPGLIGFPPMNRQQQQ